METKYGTITAMKKEKGYGFIRPDGAEERKEDLFFHARGVLSPSFHQLKIGERVEYLVREVSKGNEAYDLVVM